MAETGGYMTTEAVLDATFVAMTQGITDQKPFPVPQVPPPCDLTLGLSLMEKDVGRCVWKMEGDERFSNPAGVVQGGFIAAMIDSAMGAAVITSVESRKIFATNTDLNVRFLKPARIGKELRCEAKVISSGKTVAFVEAMVLDEDERMIATGSSTYLLIERSG
ncbi:PaaI family thioesterase [Ferrithrix thermotolerans]|uniref:PaaI family thioesterase n=1 Tax=Ferrithrix thermotolerans TaxID=209649 RepID=UPI000A01FE8B|nr:PaaI family thioesterase [Ferrithrix thermotolerans]